MIDIWLGLLLHLNQPVRYLNSIQYPYACQLFGVFRDDETTCPFCHTLHSATFLASFSPKFSPKTLSHHVFFYKTWQSERPQEREMRRIKNLIKIMTLKKTCDFLKLIWRRKFALEVCCSGAGRPRWPLQLVRPCPSERGSGFVEFSLSVFLWFCSQKQKQGEQVWYKHVSTCINSVFLDLES